MRYTQFLHNPLILAAYGNEAASHTIFSHCTWFHKLEQVIRATSLRADPRHLESAERLSFHYCTCAAAVKVEVAHSKFLAAWLNTAPVKANRVELAQSMAWSKFLTRIIASTGPNTSS